MRNPALVKSDDPSYLPPGFKRKVEPAPTQAEPRRERKFDANGCLIPPGTPPVRPRGEYVVPPTPAQIAEAQRQRKEAQEMLQTEAERLPQREAQEAHRVIDLVKATGREIWYDEEDEKIQVSPPFGWLPEQYKTVPFQLAQLRDRIAPLLPTKRPGPQTF